MSKEPDAVIFERLARGWVVLRGEEPLPGASAGFREAAVTPVYASREAAEALVEQLAREYPDQFSGMRVVQMGDPLAFMRRAAGHGIGALDLHDDQFGEALPNRGFMFMIRVEEAGRALPTVLTASATERGELGPSLTRAGIRHFLHGELLHWLRYDILDEQAAHWGVRCPFRDWESGDPFYELRSERATLRLLGSSLLGHWLLVEGATAFFTSWEAAEAFRLKELEHPSNCILPTRSIVGVNEQPLHGQLHRELRVEAVLDLPARLAELARWNPFLDVVINPEDNRENAAYTTLYGLKASAGRAWRELSKQNHNVWLRAPSGLWALQPGNELVLLDRARWWSGCDTIRWNGGMSIQLATSRTSMQSALLQRSPFDFEPRELSDSELEDEVERFLATPTEDGAALALDTFDAFVLLGWDAQSGEYLDWKFSSVFHAIRYLAAHEQEYDCRHPDGSVCHRALRSERFQRAVRQIMKRVLRDKYAPTDGADLVAMCHSTLETLHLDYLGYARDLIWATNEEERAEYLDRLAVPPGQWAAWEAQQRNYPVDSVGEQLAVTRLGWPSWQRLSQQGQCFVSTALRDLHERDGAALMDYAPITVELAKTVEVELVRILEQFRTENPDLPLPDDPEQATNAKEKILAKFYRGRSVMFGDLFTLLTWKQGKSDAVYTTWRGFLERQRNAEFLLSSDFRSQLQRVKDRYRNGGAHDSVIPKQVCDECIHEVLGKEGQPGLLAGIVACWQ